MLYSSPAPQKPSPPENEVVRDGNFGIWQMLLGFIIGMILGFILFWHML